MAETIRTIESAPESWPEVTTDQLILPPEMPIDGEAPTDTLFARGAGDLSWAWQRIEAYCAHRWTPREVIWLVQGNGDWSPPLTPTTVTKVETWQRGEWQEVAIEPHPFGRITLNGDAHRITATVGEANPAPAAVVKAASRLVNYLVQQIDAHDPDLWATSMSWVRVPEMKEGEAVPDHKTNESYTRRADYIAKALQYSGAADLLRPYRRAR